MARPLPLRTVRTCVLLALAVWAACVTAVAQMPELPAATLPYKEHVALAERFERQGEYREAAEQYAAAYAAKPRKHEYAHRAAEYFYLTKDYRRAAALYDAVRGQQSDYPLAGLNYARCLKQSGAFEAATAAYLEYVGDYAGADRDVILAIVEQEVKGAAMAQQAAATMSTSTVVEHLGAGVDGTDDEFGPMPLAPGTLYYISDRGGRTRMYRSDFRGGRWEPGAPAEQFPSVPGKHVGSGALGPGGDRFYFTLCDERVYMARPTARCELYVIVNRDGAWGKPRALPPYINTPGNSTTTPAVYRDGDREVLLFASDRLDGYGGMDLYRSERYLSSDATDFSFPQNLGPVVNTVADEVTPHYDPESQTLHFASNGFVSMGGYDVFATRGGAMGYNTPENLGSPVNGPTDDYYYHPVPGTRRAFFASNRALEPETGRTSNEDIFLARPGVPTLAVDLQVVDSASSAALAGVALAVFAVDPAGARKLIASEMSEDGFFALKLPMGSEVELDAQRLDYRRRIERVRVPERRREGYQLPPLRMGRIALPLSDVQRVEAERTAPPVATIPTATTPPATVAKVNVPTESTPRPAPAPVRSQARPATHYRIQIEARGEFVPEHRRYAGVREFGELSSDYVEGKGLYRVLVGEFEQLGAARAQLKLVRANGWRNAFVARFEDGRYRGAAK